MSAEKLIALLQELEADASFPDAPMIYLSDGEHDDLPERVRLIIEEAERFLKFRLGEAYLSCASDLKVYGFRTFSSECAAICTCKGMIAVG